jgi:DNA modification methylase
LTVRLLIGDCRERLRELEAESVHTCVTSPPYFNLRDYGVPGQIGLEDTPDAFVAALVEVFREVRRVLRKDGTCWVNLGDSYAGSWGAQSRGGPPSEASTLKGNGHTGGGPKLKNLSAVQIEAHPKRTQTGTIRQPGLKPKDLIGIPWRAAFALQAPQYLGNIAREADRAWLAALIDGEGCITILEAKSPHGSGSSYPPVLQVRMCDLECIEHAAKITGLGSPSPRQEPPSAPNQRGSYQWRINGRNAADTIAEIYPFLLIKRKQAIVAWNHQAVRDSYETKRGVTIPTAALEKQKLCRDLIQRLNQREQVDLPSWMVEPPTPYGPGWYLRQDLIWAKPNPMPESVTDRCTKAHEYLFLLSKSPKYYYDAAAIAEGLAVASVARLAQDVEAQQGSARVPGKTNGTMKAVSRKNSFARGTKDSGGVTGEKPQFRPDREPIAYEGTRNRRSVWTVATAPFKEAHFATYPPELIEPCILAGSPPGGTVLDPFGGAGTTGLVADRLQRNAVLIELNAA